MLLNCTETLHVHLQNTVTSLLLSGSLWKVTITCKLMPFCYTGTSGCVQTGLCHLRVSDPIPQGAKLTKSYRISPDIILVSEDGTGPRTEYLMLITAKCCAFKCVFLPLKVKASKNFLPIPSQRWWLCFKRLQHFLWGNFHEAGTEELIWGRRYSWMCPTLHLKSCSVSQNQGLWVLPSSTSPWDRPKPTNHCREARSNHSTVDKTIKS